MRRLAIVQSARAAIIIRRAYMVWEGLRMMRWRRLLMTVALLVAVLVVGNVLASPSAQIAPLEQLIFDTRADLELLADNVLSVGTRPEGWLGNSDVNSPTVVTDLWFDSELLANDVLGIDSRPDNWIGATASVAAILTRNVRHDIELLADEQFGNGQRPAEWRGAAPITRCDRTLQNIVSLLTELYDFELTVSASTFNYCQAVAAEIEDDLNQIYFGTQTGDQPLTDPLDLVLAVRGDLERLADEELGLNTRPDGWTNNRDRASSTLISDTFADIERLADDLLGENTRPEGWIGSSSISAASSYFSLRHDLELLADEAFAFDSRPTGWQGLLPLARCRPLDQQVIFIAGVQYGFVTETLDAQAAGFCDEAGNGANLLVENPPVLDVVESETTGDAAMSMSLSAFAYLDVAATQYMGVMPEGTEFRPLYRNFSESNMMFVTGEDFALYVDRRWTNLSDSVYRGLPTLEGVRPISFCNAFWCSGPGPTPTPTGGGPLAALVLQTTPEAPPQAGEVATTKTQVSWTNVRVTYLADNATTRTAQVTLEICLQRADIATACEPVTRVFDNATGTDRPVSGQSNGLNIYELRYGYNTNLLIEGTTLFSTDVWISDPTIR